MELRTIEIIRRPPNKNRSKGEECEVDEARAKALVAGGYAKYTDVDDDHPDNGPYRTATAEAPRNAMMPRPKRRKGGRK